MSIRLKLAFVTSAFALLPSLLWAQNSQPLRLVSDPELSPDGSTLLFTWGGDIWTAQSNGGAAQPLTTGPARERDPQFSPDGKRIAFASDHEGSFQLYVMDAAAGNPVQVTFHSSGYGLEGWFPDGKSLLASASRDHYWDDSRRFFRVHLMDSAAAALGAESAPRRADELIFDDYGAEGSLSPDGNKLLFVREGPAWWRKGYSGSQSAQVWMFDLQTKAFTKLLHSERGARSPRWTSDGKGFFYCGEHDGTFNLHRYTFADSKSEQLTRFDDDAVVLPTLSRDGKTLVFRRIFDLYRMATSPVGTPEMIELSAAVASLPAREVRRTLSEASESVFSTDGLEIAFVAGGDVYVMDTELREPVAVLATPEEERALAFSADGESLVFVSDRMGQSDLWSAKRAEPTKYWWQNERFEFTRLTEDGVTENDVRFSPDGKCIAFVKGLGELWTMAPDGSDAKLVLDCRNRPEYAWSPDSKWFAVARQDDDFNSDIWIVSADASADQVEPFNVSRHPDNESDPSWSPDGKVLAFTGRRSDDEVDIYYVFLASGDDDKSKRDRTLAKAIEKMEKERKQKDKPKGAGDEPKSGEGEKSESADKDEKEEKQDEPKSDAPKNKDDKDSPKKPVTVVIDREGMDERIRRISIPDSRESGLIWSHDSKKLAFAATVEGKRGTYSVELPDEVEPKLIAAKNGSGGRWIERGNQILWTASGVPGALSDSGKETVWKFTARQQFDLGQRLRAGFDLAWRTMRDRFYDGTLNHRDWDAIREKYSAAAAEAPDVQGLATVIQLMLGELNGSHLGFTPRPDAERGTGSSWRVETAHLGLRFDPSFAGPGWRVRDVIAKGPAQRAGARILPGEILLSINGRALDPLLDPTEVLNGPLDRDISVEVQDAAGEKRSLRLRPISQGAAHGLLYGQRLAENRKRVEELSKGSLGYLHIAGMSWPSFLKFEEQLYAVGAGKSGLVIDVRENGGGSTADHLLTALTQPIHAITVPRGGGPGYPHDRKVYATWNKPIVVLCNQNSFSNAEIFSHAIKTLGRGRLVGVTTAGGVISTGAADILDLGTLRLPFRGWYLAETGEDMELNGAVPDVLIWPAPGDLPAGVDTQLDEATRLLVQEVNAWLARPAPKLRKASER